MNVCALEAQSKRTSRNKSMNMVGFRHLVLQISGVITQHKGPLERSILALAATANLLSIGVRFCELDLDEVTVYLEKLFI